MSFYEALADDYDDMTAFDHRMAAAENLVRTILRRRPVESAVDVACGTGLYALALARCGVPKVVGVDLEPAMLAKAARHARNLGVRPHFVAADMERLGAVVDASYDLILCLGNSLPHVLDPSARRRTLEGFRSLLSPGGELLVQTLNFDRILEKSERIVSIDRNMNREFIRFYDFLESGLVRFNLLRLVWGENGVEHDLQSTLLRPCLSRELIREFEACGLRNVQVFGSPALGAFNADRSPTCLVTGRAPQEDACPDRVRKL
ncbi:MAG: class I SAM-dependent methyltransferase [Kiritimatiellaeota bacterium]|nr:class I SAM-dependent methyltransferase [Kiritimatiellota bacterium]